MTQGQPFNPWRGDERTPGCGFYAADVIARQRTLTDGQKRLYERLVRYAGRDGHCYPSQRQLADDLGKCERQIRSDLQKLEEARLIGHRSRDGRRSNTYVFLWHEMFDESIGRDLSGGGLPVNPAEQAPEQVVERRWTAGQPDSASGSRVPVNAFERKPTAGHLSGSPLPVNGFERQDRVHLSGSGLPGNSVQEFSTHTLSGFPDGSRGSASALTAKPAPRPLPVLSHFPHWPSGGWGSPEEFEAWWSELVALHPNKSRNGVAKTKALELIATGQLRRADFDEGYAALREASGDRWTEQRGRFAPNLFTLLDDALWKHAPPPVAAVSAGPAYEDASEYLRRISAE